MESMECAITALRLNGLRLKQAEWPAAVRGSLVVVDWDGQGNGFRRHLRRADLWESLQSASRRQLLTMFDPVFLKTVDGGFLLSGVELEGRRTEGEHRLYEHQQLWLVVPVGR